MTILLSVVVVLLASLGLAVGVLLGRPPIKGSCGGLAGCGSGIACAACSRNDREARP